MKYDYNLNIKKSIFWNTFGSIFYLMSQWFISVLIVRFSGYKQAGYLSLAMSSTSIFTNIALYGMRSFQVSDCNEKYDNITYIVSRIMTVMVAYLMCIIYVTIINYSDIQSLSILAFMLIRAVESVADVYDGILQKYWHMDIVGKSFIYRGIATLVLFVLSFKFTNNLPITLLLISIGCVIIVIYYNIGYLKKIIKTKITIDIAKIKKLLLECLPLVSSTFLLSINGFLPRYFLERQLGSEALGIYSSIATPTLIIQVLSGVIFTPLVPLFAKSYLDKNMFDFFKLLKKCILSIGIFSFVSILGAKLLGKIGLYILFGKEILTYYNLLIPIVLCTILTAIIWFGNSVLTSIRKLYSITLCSILSSITCLCLSNYFIAKYEMNGASYVFICAQSIQVFLMSLFFTKTFNSSNNIKNID